jgi:L-ascorbate metabolism protein UlaG (beta-lactamase superfamily)
MNWLGHLCREWTFASWRGIASASTKPEPQRWDDSRVTAAWLGHATVLINFFGVAILTDPVLFPRIGIRLPWFTIGPKRLTRPALEWNELPPIDLILLSHAHFDHFDTRTLHSLSRHNQAKADFDNSTAVITAPRTSDLLRWMRFRAVTELHWGEERKVILPNESVTVKAIRVNHWGARMLRDTYRGYNGYIIEARGRRIIFGGDTAFTDAFAELRDDRPYDLAIMSIGAYNPWIRVHANPEQVIAMCDAAGVRYIMPVHHQTFRLSVEPFCEPIERFEAVLQKQPERIALREIGETFVLPM